MFVFMTLNFLSCLQTDQDKENFQKLVNAMKKSKSVSMSKANIEFAAITEQLSKNINLATSAVQKADCSTTRCFVVKHQAKQVRPQFLHVVFLSVPISFLYFPQQ